MDVVREPVASTVGGFTVPAFRCHVTPAGVPAPGVISIVKLCDGASKSAPLIVGVGIVFAEVVVENAVVLLDSPPADETPEYCQLSVSAGVSPECVSV